MKHKIPTLNNTSVYARTDMQQLSREMMRVEGIRSVNRMVAYL